MGHHYSDFLYNGRHYRDIPLWRNITESEWNDFQWQEKNAIRDPDDLKKVIRIDKAQLNDIKKVVSQLRKQGKEPFRITPYYASLMNENPFFARKPDGSDDERYLDPIFWQSVPTPATLMYPNAAIEASMAEGSRSYGAVYQRYPNRVALFVGPNTNCASYCQHCQRTKSLDATSSITREHIEKGLFYIEYNKNIDEVLVTGGDALQINIKLLSHILTRLGAMEHIRVIRIATRVPVVLPMKITDKLLQTISTSVNKLNKGYPKHIYFMTHINHYQEITPWLLEAARKIMSYGFLIRNQTVFLNHVNATFQTLAETFRRMTWCGIHPYYLLQCHKEKGLIHFIAPIYLGKLIMKNLQGWISGIAKPQYVSNVPYGGGKVMLMPTGHFPYPYALDIEKRYNPTATVITWEGNVIPEYEALGRVSQKEYVASIEVMNKFIQRPGVYRPNLIVVNDQNEILFVSNLHFHQPTNEEKTTILHYQPYADKLPITNPATIENELNFMFERKNNPESSASG